MRRLQAYFPSKWGSNSSVGLFEPDVDRLRLRIEKCVVCPRLGVAKAILLSIIPALSSSRSHKQITLSLTEQSTDIVIKISSLIETAENIPQLDENVSQLEKTLRNIYAFIKSETSSSLLLVDEKLSRHLVLREQLTSILDDFERCCRLIQPPLQQDKYSKPVVHPYPVQSDDSNVHESVSFFANANNVIVNGGGFYGVRNGNMIIRQAEPSNTSTGIVQALRVLENHAETTNGRMDRMEGNMQAMMGFFQTFLGSQQIPTSISMGFVYLMDATGRQHPVPMNMACSFEQFNEALRVLFQPNTFQGKALRKHMDAGAYDLCIDDGRYILQITHQGTWSSIRPGTTLVMSIVQVRTYGWEKQCPVCNIWNRPEDGFRESSIDCRRCQRRLYITYNHGRPILKGGNKEVETSPVLTEELELFRNIHVEEYNDEWIPDGCRHPHPDIVRLPKRQPIIRSEPIVCNSTLLGCLRNLDILRPFFDSERVLKIIRNLIF